MTETTTETTEQSRGAWRPSDHERRRRRVRRWRRLRSRVVATLVTVVVLGAAGFGLVSSPGWDRVRESFFNGYHARASFPEILDRFWVNVVVFLAAEPAILVLGLAIALVRQTRSPLLTPLRLLAVVWTDLFRGIPTVLLVLLMGFGVPALQLQGVTNSALVWAAVALVISYSAYVAEVFRSGIEAVHPSQVASAEALGLTRGQTMRFVVVPQAVRRVVPPLLNDFVSLQKDTALVALVGAFDAVFAAQDYTLYKFNYTPYVVVAGFFVVITIPMARLTDRISRRWAERERAGAR